MLALIMVKTSAVGFKTVVSILILTLWLSGCIGGQIKQDEKSSLHLDVAIAYIRSEQYPLALKELLEAEALNPKNSAVQANLGLVYYARERNDLAEKHYLKALSLYPKFSDAKNNLARIYIDLGKFDKAEKLLNEVLDDLLYPDIHKTYFNYGLMRFKQNRFKEAEVQFKKAAEINRSNCDNEVYLARTRMELGDAALAKNMFENAIPVCSDVGRSDATFFSAISLYRTNEKNKAVDRFKELQRKFPKSPYTEKAKNMLSLIEKEIH